MPRSELRSTIRRVIGASLIIAGLALNKWTLEAFVVPDGAIETPSVNLLLFAINLTLVTVGALIWFIRGEWVTNVAVSLASLAVALLVIEGAFRLLGIQAEYPPPRIDRVLRPPDGPTERAPHAFVPLATVRTTYASDPRGYFDPGNRIDHVHNSAGWRDVEHSIEKPPNTFRILGLGDSYLWGQGVRYNDIVLTRLGVLLADQLPGLATETINTGISGANTASQRDLLQDRGLDYDPDLIILFYVPNDVAERFSGDRRQIEFFVNYTSIYQRPDLLSNYSYLWGWARQRFQMSYKARRYVKESVAAFVEDDRKWEQSRRALDAIRRISHERGIPLLVVIFPFFHNLDGEYPFQVVHDVVREYCESVEIPVLDLRDSYRDHQGPELWVHPTDQHPNEIAHDIAARAIAEYLRVHANTLLSRAEPLSASGSGGGEPVSAR